VLLPTPPELPHRISCILYCFARSTTDRSPNAFLRLFNARFYLRHPPQPPPSYNYYLHTTSFCYKFCYRTKLCLFLLLSVSVAINNSNTSTFCHPHLSFRSVCSLRLPVLFWAVSSERSLRCPLQALCLFRPATGAPVHGFTAAGGAFEPPPQPPQPPCWKPWWVRWVARTQRAKSCAGACWGGGN